MYIYIYIYLHVYIYMTSDEQKYYDKLEKLRYNYWSASEFRLSQNEENRNRSKVRVICFECKRDFADG